MDAKSLKKIKIVVSVSVVLLLAYFILLIDIGIWNGTASPWGMIRLYAVTGRSFPWLGILIASAIALGLIHHFAKPSMEEDPRDFEYADSDVYGSAREMDMDELKSVFDIGPIEDLGGTIIGMLDDSARQCLAIPISSTTNRNLIEFGIPGRGKTFAHVLGAICSAIRRGESIVCTDTKGELYSKTSEYARSRGYIPRRINLKNPETSDGWAVLKELRLNNVRAMIFTQVVMANTGNDTDPHKALEQSLLRACCLYIERNDAIPEQEKTLYAAYKMICEGADALDRAFANCATVPKLKIAADTYAVFKGSSPNLKGNTISNLCARLQVLSDPAIQYLTSKDDIDLTLPGKRKCIYYVIMSDQHDTMRFLGSLFFSYLFLDLAEYGDTCPGSHLPVPVNVILEEAYAIGRLYGITNALSTARSRGIAITMILQGYGQLKELYGDDAATTILNDCAYHLCIGTNDQQTADLMAWETGEATTKVRTEQHPKGESRFFPSKQLGYSEGFGRRLVYTSSEIRQLKPGRILICCQGHNCKMARTVGINLYPEYKRGLMPQIDTFTRVPLSDNIAREYIRQVETKYIEDYEQWISDGGNDWSGFGYRSQPLRKRKSGVTRPDMIPYPELEKMALMRSKAVRESVKGDTGDDFPPLDDAFYDPVEEYDNEEAGDDSEYGESEYADDFDFDVSVDEEADGDPSGEPENEPGDRQENKEQFRQLRPDPAPPVQTRRETERTVPDRSALQNSYPAQPAAASDAERRRMKKSQRPAVPSYDGKRQSFSERGTRKGGFDVSKMNRD